MDGQLRELWDDKSLSTNEIGRRMGLSKNSVVGRAHRIGLEAKPSPIRREPADQEAYARKLAAAAALRRPKVTLPPLVQSGEAPPEPAHEPRPVVKQAPVAVSRPVKPVFVALPPPPPKPVYHRVSTCCWPIGRPGTKEFRFCDEEVIGRGPYCEKCSAIAYTRPRRSVAESENAYLKKILAAV